eukprot:gene7295-411_t
MSNPGQSCVNSIVYEKILKIAVGSQTACETDRETVHEYGDCHYLLHTFPSTSPKQPPQLHLSFSFPEMPGHFNSVILTEAAMEVIKRMYAGVASVITTEPGYQVTLDVDIVFLACLSPADRETAVKTYTPSATLVYLQVTLDVDIVLLACLSPADRETAVKTYTPSATLVYLQVTLDVDIVFLARLSPADREMAVKNLASIRTAVTGAPLRDHFMRLSRGLGAARPIETHWNRPGQEYFVKPEAVNVTVIFPISFVSKLDAAIGISFLRASVPEELAGFERESPQVEGELNGGYMRFIFLPRHVDGPQVEHVLWSMSSFYYTISYHIKRAKACEPLPLPEPAQDFPPPPDTSQPTPPSTPTSEVASALKRLKEAAPDQKLLLAQQCLTALIMTVDNLADDSMENQFAITAIDALKSPAQAQLTVRLAFLATSLHLAGPPVQYSHWVTAMQLFVDDTNRPTRVDPCYFLPTGL